jgi:hypothetical protein
VTSYPEASQVIERVRRQAAESQKQSFHLAIPLAPSVPRCGPCLQACLQGRRCPARKPTTIRQALWPLEREARVRYLRRLRDDLAPMDHRLPGVLNELRDMEGADTPPVTVDAAQMWAYLTVIALALSAVAMVVYGLTRLP